MLVGGELIDDSIFDKIITGATLEEVVLDPPEVIEYLLSEITYNENIYNYKTMMIGDRQYWKFYDNPNAPGAWD
jgi:hypothetical protein